MEKPVKTAEIKILVGLDAEKVPVTLEWEAADSGIEGRKPCKSLMLSVWDPAEQATLKIDLWTKDMPVDEMKRFFYETFMSMANTYEKATGEKEKAKEIREFAKGMGSNA